uniref:Uncharacterized protein n=1 Tax=Rhizophora mucronata TaxID=61149 RepID=A0A2P2IMK9_RHIMU
MLATRGKIKFQYGGHMQRIKNY